MIATPATPEQCVVGIMALDSKTILYCIDHLSEDDFADGACKAAFAEIRDLYTSRGYYSEDDVILLRSKDTVMYCAEIMPPISGYRKFVKAVKDNAIRRKAALLGLLFGRGREKYRPAARNVYRACQRPYRRFGG